MTEKVTHEGRIVKKRVAIGSKSERDSIVLEGVDGDKILRRMGGHPFEDADLESLVGKTVRAHGFEDGSNLIMTEWSEV